MPNPFNSFQLFQPILHSQNLSSPFLRCNLPNAKSQIALQALHTNPYKSKFQAAQAIQGISLATFQIAGSKSSKDCNFWKFSNPDIRQVTHDFAQISIDGPTFNLSSVQSWWDLTTSDLLLLCCYDFMHDFVIFTLRTSRPQLWLQFQLSHGFCNSWLHSWLNSQVICASRFSLGIKDIARWARQSQKSRHSLWQSLKCESNFAMCIMWHTHFDCQKLESPSLWFYRKLLVL